MKFPRLRFLTSADVRQINGVTRRLARCDSPEELGRRFVAEVDSCIPGGMNAWNEANADYSAVTGLYVTEGYWTEISPRMDAISAHIGDHPVISSAGWEFGLDGPRMISDYATSREFMQTPLYVEGYRHVHARHQLCYALPGLIEGVRLSLSLNRDGRGYDERDRDRLHLLGLRVFELFALQRERCVLQAQVAKLESAFGFAQSGVQSLTPAELSLLGRMLGREKTAGLVSPLSESERKRRDAVIEKLQLESSTQLFACLTELRA